MKKHKKKMEKLMGISHDVYKEDGEAEKLLCERCKRTGYTRIEVIEMLGDPRKWNVDDE